MHADNSRVWLAFALRLVPLLAVWLVLRACGCQH